MKDVRRQRQGTPGIAIFLATFFCVLVFAALPPTTANASSPRHEMRREKPKERPVEERARREKGSKKEARAEKEKRKEPKLEFKEKLRAETKTREKSGVEKLREIKPGSSFKLREEFLKNHGAATTSKAENTRNREDPGKQYKYGPYERKSQVITRTTRSPEKYIRVYNLAKNGPAGSFLCKAKDINGLNPKQIQQKFALNYVPKRYVEVLVPARSEISMGVAGAKVAKGYYDEKRKDGSSAPNSEGLSRARGGGIQYELHTRLPKATAFSKSRDKEIGSVFRSSWGVEQKGKSPLKIPKK